MKFKAIDLITASGLGAGIAETLFARGWGMIDVHHARGSLPGGPTKRDGTPIESEQDIVTVVVDEQKAEDTFRAIHELAKVAESPGSFMYMRSLSHATSPHFVQAPVRDRSSD